MAQRLVLSVLGVGSYGGTGGPRSLVTGSDKFQQFIARVQFLDKVLDKPVVVHRQVSWSRQCRSLAFPYSSWTRLLLSLFVQRQEHGPDNAVSCSYWTRLLLCPFVRRQCSWSKQCRKSESSVQFLDKVVDVPVVFQRLVPWSGCPS